MGLIDSLSESEVRTWRAAILFDMETGELFHVVMLYPQTTTPDSLIGFIVMDAQAAFNWIQRNPPLSLPSGCAVAAPVDDFYFLDTATHV